jgi:2Fe-2S ferredoxin
MVDIYVTDRTGQKHKLQAPAGSMLMEVLRDNNMGVEAICGGCCSCATCHVLIDQEKWASKVPARSEDENDLLLATASYDAKDSRLSCQIRLTEDLGGLEVTVAPPD